MSFWGSCYASSVSVGVCAPVSLRYTATSGNADIHRYQDIKRKNRKNIWGGLLVFGLLVFGLISVDS